MVQQSSRFNLRIDPDLLAALEQIAEAADRSVAWVVRDALRSYVLNRPPASGVQKGSADRPSFGPET